VQRAAHRGGFSVRSACLVWRIRRAEEIYSGNEFLSRGREHLVFYEESK